MGKSNKRRRYSDGTAFKQAGTVVGGGGGSGKKGPMSREINRLLRKVRAIWELNEPSAWKLIRVSAVVLQREIAHRYQRLHDVSCVRKA